MSDHETHRRFSRLFGLDSSKVDKYIDRPYKFLGRKHRKLRHDVATIVYLGLKDGEEAMISAYLHVLLDEDRSLARLFKSLKELEG